ncbi:trypsin-like serine protease, partial [Xenorhabdus innexi]
MLTSPPRETIARGEESCIEGKDSQCKPWVIHIYHEIKLGQYKKTISACTGSLIAPSYILTASHCYYYPKSDGPSGQVSFEGYIIKDYKKKIIGRGDPKNFFPYSESGKSADFAIIKLDRPINLHDFGHVSRFFYYDNAYEKNEKDYYNTSIYGYGSLGIDERTGNSIEGTGEQKRADVKIITATKDFKGNDGLIIKENEALTAEVSQPGDSGGPTIWHNTIIGVISSGEKALAKKDPGSKRPLNFSLISDVTGKYLTTKFYQPKDLGHWFSNTMKQIWIDSPDWNGRVSKRKKYIPVRGYGRPDSKIKLSYSIDNKPVKDIECPDRVGIDGEWKCLIPYDSYFTDVTDEKQYNINITVRESEEVYNKWREDALTAEIPSIKQELSIVYPLNNSVVHTNNFTIRGYAAPNSDIKLELSPDQKKPLKQDALCDKIIDNQLIKTNESGLWTCTIKPYLTISDLGKKFHIIVEQENSSNNNIFDKVNITLQLKNYTDLKLDLRTGDEVSIYRKMLDLNVTYDKNASVICIFNTFIFHCKNKPDYSHFNIPNIIKDIKNKKPTQPKEWSLNINALQVIDGQDLFDLNHWYDTSFKTKGEYFRPKFDEKYSIKSPRIIQSSKSKNKKFSGFGGDNKRYTQEYYSTFLPSEYSICMKENSHSPSGSPQCNRTEDRDIYVRIPLKENTYFSEIPIQYSDYNGIHN